MIKLDGIILFIEYIFLSLFYGLFLCVIGINKVIIVVLMYV